MEDAQVLGWTIGTSEADFKLMVDRFGAPAMALAMNILGNRQDAEDACQEAFIRIFRNLDRVDAGKNIKNWLYTIVYHSSLDILKKKSRTAKLFFEFKNESPAVTPPETESSGRKAALPADILKKLNPKEKTALSLWAGEGYTAVEISEVLRCSPSTARVHLFNARKKIKTFLEKKHDPLSHRRFSF